jgi:hypothetical protein
MRYLLISLAALLVAAPAFAAPEIVIFYSWADHVPAWDAAIAIGADVKAYAAYEEDAWIADVLDGCDVAVFDCCSNYTEPPADASLQLDALVDYLHQFECGRVIVALWFMAYEIGHPLWGLMGVSYAYDFTSTMPIYKWVAHPIWDGLPDVLTTTGDSWYRDGAAVSVHSGAIAIGGFYGHTPTTNDCALVVSGDERCVYIGETGVDGAPEWTDLYINCYDYLLTHGPSATEQTTWGSVKALYK